MLTTLVKVVLIATVAGVAVGGLTAAGRHFGLPVSEGVMMGVIVGIAGGLGGYVANHRAKKNESGSDSGKL
jgi:hypothetical protein